MYMYRKVSEYLKQWKDSKYRNPFRCMLSSAFVMIDAVVQFIVPSPCKPTL